MALRSTAVLGIKYMQELSHGFLCPAIQSATNLQFVRYRRAKHFTPKFKRLRGLKVLKVELPDFNEASQELSEEQMRSKLKEKGVQPTRPWMEKPIFISATGGIFEAYVPPEGDGKLSAITAQGAKQKLQFLEKKTKTMLAIRKVRSFEEDFDTPDFCDLAQNVYVKAHECIAQRDKEGIQQYVTEHAYPKILHNIEGRTVNWKFLSAIELPRVVHARCTDIVTKENIFAQITVRFHTQQLLAVYDRFGRLMHGSEILAKDVLEYVVFEKHIANEYGVWRIHDKIIPNWMPPREPSSRTYLKPVVPKDLPDANVAVAETSNENAKTVAPLTDSEKPVISAS